MSDIITWFFYNVLVPLAPVPLVYFGAWLLGAPKRLATIVRDGQVCFYCTTLSAACINDIVNFMDAAQKVGSKPHSTIGIAIAGAIFCIILSTFTYAVATIAADRASLDETKFAGTSLATTVATIVIVASIRFGMLTP